MRIPPKAYFNNKKLIDVYIEPDTEEIGDWAYSKCTNLREVRIPAGCRISARAYEDCPALESVVVYERGSVLESEEYARLQVAESVMRDRGANEAGDMSHLLGLCIRNWPDMADILVDHSRSDLIGLVDSRLKLYLAEPDDSGFVPFLAGGEEDYDDADAAREQHVHGRLVNKVLLVYERLRHDPAEQVYVEYLRRHNPDITFAVLMSSDPYISDYRSLYFNLGLNTPGTDFTRTLLDMSSRDAELRAMVLTRAAKPDDTSLIL